MEIVFLFFSVVLLFLTAGIAWVIRAYGDRIHPVDLNQKAVGIILWLIIGFGVRLMLNVVGLSVTIATAIVILVSTVGFFLDDILATIKDPAASPPKAPTK